MCTIDDLAKLKDIFNETDVIESFIKEGRMNTKWRFSKLTNLTFFADLLKHVPIVCKDFFLPEPLLRNCTINSITYEENTKEPPKKITCVSFALLLSICVANNDWLKKLQPISFHSKIEWTDSVPLIPRESA